MKDDATTPGNSLKLYKKTKVVRLHSVPLHIAANYKPSESDTHSSKEFRKSVEDDALISYGSFMQTKYLCVLIHI